ncbi:MAG TPA: NAD(P)/FAD-dependent oxidoreductase, partial [Gemmataceae bacterium]|nr:NAD(P)/FAD-dependent oxidoreductase [Gemmataceae bacterium]
MSQPARPYDVIIIGGGPAGAAAGMTLARHGLRAVILEKARHPRFHIGESLLPRNYTLLQEFGLEKKMQDVPHVPKYGAEFGMGGGTETSLFNFDSGFTPNQRTFNVERALFDKMLLDSAREDGTEVREDVAVRKILKLEDGDVRVLLDTGEELAGKWLFDASGQATVVGRHLNTRKPTSERHLQKVAYFSHFENVMRHDGREHGHPLIVMCDEGWFWLIHINDTVTSIGLVMDAELARSTGVPADQMLYWGMQRCPLIRSRCHDATGPTTNQTIANFSYKCDPFAGPGYFLVGDSGAFVDPIFSTGVCLAMLEARRAADHVNAILDKRITPSAARKDYVRFARRSTSIYFDMIRQFYRHSFRELFLNGTGPYQVHKAVLSVLAGHVFPKPK